MVCSHCGKEYPDDATGCTACGASLPPKADITTPMEIAAPPQRRRFKMTGSLTLGLVLLIGLGAGLAAKYLFVSAPLMALVPEKCPLLISVNASWWWDTTGDLRAQPGMKASMAKMEKETGISIQRDIIPWVGQIAIMPLSMDAQQPSGVIYIEVRDRSALRKRLGDLRQKMQRSSKEEWTATKYKGVRLQRAVIKRPGGVAMPVATSMIGGWIVMSFGDNSMETVIDTWKGDTPSMQKNANWNKAMAKLPEHYCLLIGANNAELTGMLMAKNPMAKAMFGSMDLYDYMAVGTLRETADGLRMDAVEVANNDKLKESWRKIAASITPIDGSSLRELPDGTFFAMSVANPGKPWTVCKQVLIDAMNPLMQQGMAQGLDQLKPFEAIVDTCTGECSMAMAWQKQRGFGLMLLGDTKSAAQAQLSTTRLQTALAAKKVPITKAGNTYLVKMTKKSDPIFPTAPCWTARETWLRFSTHPAWLKAGATKTAWPLPAEARGSDYVVMAKLAELPAFLNYLEGQPGVSRKTLDTIRQQHLERVEMLAFERNIDGGATRTASMLISNWNWRKSLALLPKAIEDADGIPRTK